MIVFFKRLFLIAGVVTIISPAMMLLVWNRYVNEQESQYGILASEYKECDPYELLLTYDTQDRLTFRWKTKEECSGTLLLGKSYSDFSLEPYTVSAAQSSEKTKEHAITLIKQDELAFTYAVIVSNGVWFGIQGVPFAFKQITVADVSQ